LSFNDDILYEKFTNMEPDKASELILSILLTSNPPERREKAIQKLIEIKDNTHFQEIKSAYLNETHSNVKLSFIKLISKFYGEEGIEFLKMQYKNEKDWKIRKEIVISVGDRSQYDNLDFFLDALKDSNIRIKKKSIQYLGQIRDSKAFEGLMDLLKYGNTEYHRDLIKSIVNIIRNSEEQLISKYIEDSNIHIQRAIPLILRRIENDESIGYLMDLLKQNDSIIKENCLMALGKFKNSNDPTTIKAIIEELNNESSEVKQEAIKALGRIGNKAATFHLLKELKDKDDMTRKYAINALKSLMKDTSSIKRLQNLLVSRNIIERIAAIKLIGKLGDKTSLETLINSLNSNNSKVRRASYNAILKIVNGESLDNIVENLNASESQIRKWSAKILFNKMKKENEEEIIIHLLNLLEDNESNVRRTAINLLSKLDNPLILDRINKKLKNSPNWKMRRSCIRLLSKINSQKTLKLLIQYIHDEDFFIQNWVLKAIGRKENFENITLIIDLLNNKDERIKIAAIKSLAKVGDNSVISSLVEQLGDTNWEVRKATENALNNINPNWMDTI